MWIIKFFFVMASYFFILSLANITIQMLSPVFLGTITAVLIVACLLSSSSITIYKTDIKKGDKK